MAEVTPAPNSVYRLGGDEFVVVIPSAESATAVVRLAERVGVVMDGRYLSAHTPVVLAASVGCAYGAADDIESLLRTADSKMYEDKARRRSDWWKSAELRR